MPFRTRAVRHPRGPAALPDGPRLLYRAVWHNERWWLYHDHRQPAAAVLSSLEVCAQFIRFRHPGQRVMLLAVVAGTAD